jgi:hypothetical protein
MDAPSISIKIRGLQALEAMNGNGQLMGGIKIKGAGALMGLREIEGNRAIMAKKGLMMRELELEGRRMMLQPSNGATAAKGAITKGTTATATMKGVAAKSAVVSGAGGAAAMSSVGWGLGLGGLGPWLALAALGLAATGIYFYLRAQQLAKASTEDLDELDSRD